MIPRISFIVPFYGVERYIQQCLESVYQQDIPETEYEVICVNDCSPDNSEKIVLQYSAQHANLHLFRHDVNKKLGAARNTGLLAARGEYVWFLDSDDYIKENCLGEILSLCEKGNLDILHFSIQDNQGNVLRHVPETDVICGIEEELICKRQQSIEITFPWNRVYRRTFLLYNNLFFNNLYGGDTIHTILSTDAAQRVKNVDKCFHYYRTDNNTSDTHGIQTAEKVYNMVYVLAKAVYDIEPMVNERWRSLIAESCPWRMNSGWKIILRMPYKERQKLYLLLHSDEELFDFTIRTVDKKNKWILSHEGLVKFLSLVYKVMLYIKRKIK